MRISDWSSDVCSSDLTNAGPLAAIPCDILTAAPEPAEPQPGPAGTTGRTTGLHPKSGMCYERSPFRGAARVAGGSSSGRTTDSDSVNPGSNPGPISEERRVGKECGSTLRYRGSPSV